MMMDFHLTTILGLEMIVFKPNVHPMLSLIEKGKWWICCCCSNILRNLCLLKLNLKRYLDEGNPHLQPFWPILR